MAETPSRNEEEMMLYCIAHEQMVKASRIFDTIPVLHPDGVKDARVIEVGLQHFTNKHEAGEPPQYDPCDFSMGWATTPPPEIEQSWVEHVVEPDENEMEAINKQAEILLAELA